LENIFVEELNDLKTASKNSKKKGILEFKISEVENKI